MLLILPVLLSGCLAGREANTAERLIRDVTVEEAAILLQNNTDNPDFVLLDVRTSEEFAGERLDKAVNLDYYVRNFQESLSRLDRNKVYLVYCRTGRRSGLALRMMDDLGF
jgi:rhodanese-related sulfurtransferase